jgi:hypothetical protein
MTVALWPFPVRLHVGRTSGGLLALIVVWRRRGCWCHWRLRLA